MTDLTIDGEIFRVEVEGDPGKPCVLLSPSLGTDLTLFDAQMPALLEHFRVVRYDPRGHGRSTTRGAPYSLARLGADALAILDALEIEQAHVVGISMGGAVAQWLLVNAPGRVGRAVLANTAARLGTPDLWNTRIAKVLSEGTGTLAAVTMERWFSDAFRAAASGRVASIERLFRATSAEGYAGCCAALRDMDLREALREIGRPVLIVTGRDDPVTSAADLAAMTDAIAGARHVVLDCRHISNIEAQAAFDAAIIDFLTARSAGPRAVRKPAVRRPTRGRGAVARSPLKPARAREARLSPRRATTARKAEPTTAKAPRAAATAKKAAAKPGRAAVAKPVAKKAVVKKPVAKKAIAKKAIAKKAVAKKAVAKKAVAKKAVAKKAVAKKPITKKAVAKKPVAKKPPARRQPTKGKPGRKR